MRSSEAFPGKYLRAADILGREISVMIAGIKHEEMQDGEMKWVVYFENKVKGVVLNKTNWDALEDAYGDSDDWTGHPAILFTMKTQNPAGATVDGIRIRAKKAKAIPRHQKQAMEMTENPAEDMDEDIPF